MNNEIKEMLYKLDSISNGAYNNDGYVDLKQNEAHLLLDYITKLQQENERLKLNKHQLKQKLEAKNKRIKTIKDILNGRSDE